ncbi:cytochrome c3 family protein [Desulfospira joergensenii]|uniref:cytochrome c3 family protein n=1 Tax=Desulfospira joergensenii TaxID=53329 RepID=UPI0003B30669|nr:cytochrome c3 family protein [Desulfospira joergensenii]
MQTGTMNQAKKSKPGQIFFLLAAGCFFLALAWPSSVWAKISASSGSDWFVQMDQYAAGAHGTLKCEDCHGPMQAKGKSHPDPEAAGFLKTDPKRTFDYQTCKKCHKTAHERFLKGEHAKAAEKEKKEGKPSQTGFAPTCGDCHSAHYSKSRKSRADTGKEMTRTCGACHPDQEASYLDNYHGKAGVNLGYDKAAFCTDCHGAHTAVSLKDKTQVLTTCRRCHPDATAAFADIIIHDTTKNLTVKTDAKQKGLKWVHALGTLSLIFVVAVLVFFYAHTGLLMLRKLHEKLRRHK